MKAITNIVVVLENKVIDNGFVLLHNDLIKDFGDMSDFDYDCEIIQTNATHVMPGFIDIHTHGGYGYDFMNPDHDELMKFTKKVMNEGVTTLLGSTMTEPILEIQQALANLTKYDNSNVDILGAHLEGPFISETFKGAQAPDNIIDINVEVFDYINLYNNIKMATIAPEKDKDYKLTHHLASLGIIPAVGHSDATCDQVRQAIKHGASNITHFYNGQHGFNHREVGVVGAGLLFKNEIKAELICDLIHVNPDAINILVNAKGFDNVILITDSMRAKGLEPGEYSLGGQKVIVDETSARLESGALAGSIAKLNNCAHNFKTVTNCNFSELSKVTALNAAKLLKIEEHYGSIDVAKKANLILTNDNLEILSVIKNGEIAI